MRKKLKIAIGHLECVAAQLQSTILTQQHAKYIPNSGQNIYWITHDWENVNQ